MIDNIYTHHHSLSPLTKKTIWKKKTEKKLTQEKTLFTFTHKKSADETTKLYKETFEKKRHKKFYVKENQILPLTILSIKLSLPQLPTPPNTLIQTHLTQYFQVGIILFNVIHETQIFLRV